MKTHTAAKCQAKDPSTCPYHGSSSKAAAVRGDINAFIAAKISEQPDLTPQDLERLLSEKPSYPANFKSKETVQLDGKVYDTEDLVKGKDLGHYTINKVLDRSIAGTIHAPTEDLKTLRLQAALFAKEVQNTAEEMRDKKFGRFTSKKTKEEYYTSQLAKMKKAYNLETQYTAEVLHKEGITIMTPEQSGQVYEIEAGGVKLFHEDYIYEHVEKEHNAIILDNATKAVKKFQETGEFNLRPYDGVPMWA